MGVCVGAGVACVLGDGWSGPEPQWEWGKGLRQRHRDREAGDMGTGAGYRCSRGEGAVGGQEEVGA